MKDGGPAFPFTPNPQPHNSDGTWCQDWDMGDSGMTLRDYFAAKALQQVAGELKETHPPVEIAEWCYIMADAMLAARDKEKV